MYLTVFVLVFGGKKLLKVFFCNEKYSIPSERKKNLWQDHKDKGYNLSNRGFIKRREGSCASLFWANIETAH